MTYDATRDCCFTRNLVILQPFKFKLFRNHLKFLGVNNAKTSSKLRWISPKLCCSIFVPGQSVQPYISHQCPSAAIESMVTDIMGFKPCGKQTRKQIFKSASSFVIKYYQRIPFVPILMSHEQEFALQNIANIAKKTRKNNLYRSGQLKRNKTIMGPTS